MADRMDNAALPQYEASSSSGSLELANMHLLAHVYQRISAAEVYW